jgi:hypothetical protein
MIGDIHKLNTVRISLTCPLLLQATLGLLNPSFLCPYKFLTILSVPDSIIMFLDVSVASARYLPPLGDG